MLLLASTWGEDSPSWKEVKGRNGRKEWNRRNGITGMEWKERNKRNGMEYKEWNGRESEGKKEGSKRKEWKEGMEGME